MCRCVKVHVAHFQILHVCCLFLNISTSLLQQKNRGLNEWKIISFQYVTFCWKCTKFLCIAVINTHENTLLKTNQESNSIYLLLQHTILLLQCLLLYGQDNPVIWCMYEYWILYFLLNLGDLLLPSTFRCMKVPSIFRCTWELDCTSLWWHHWAMLKTSKTSIPS